MSNSSMECTNSVVHSVRLSTSSLQSGSAGTAVSTYTVTTNMHSQSHISVYYFTSLRTATEFTSLYLYHMCIVVSSTAGLFTDLGGDGLVELKPNTSAYEAWSRGKSHRGRELIDV